MEWNLETIIVQGTLAVAMLMGLLYSYITVHYSLWKKKGVPYAEPKFPFGNAKDLVMTKVDIGRFYDRFYKQFKSDKYGGILELRRPSLILTDLDMVKQILTKDFISFMDRDLPPMSNKDFLMYNLFFMEGKEWKEMRQKLTPTFTSGKMKLMYYLIEKCSQQLKQHLDPLAEDSSVVDIKEITSRFTIDIIATCAFGVEVNTIGNCNTEFYDVSQLIFKQSKILMLKRFLMLTFPRTARFFQLTLIDKKVKEFLLTLVETTVKFREENNVQRDDFLDLLIKIKNNQALDHDANGHQNNSTKHGALTFKEMAAQAFVFFAAGFETAASTTTFLLYELARNPEIQEKLRREIDEVMELHGGKITYDAIHEMTYMEQVLNETLRMHGSAPILIRKSTEPYKFQKTNITLEKDIKVVVPVYSIHHDPDIYPDPHVFDPDRFTKENIKSRHNYSFLPFGEGPRMCIGLRFGKMQVKAALSTIIANYELKMTPETPLTVEISPKSITTTPLHPIKLQILKRSY